MGLGVVAAAATAQAGPVKPLTSHCSPAERVVATCTMKNGKSLSLCASRDLGPKTGFLQYRFGKLSVVPEMSFPEKREHPSRHFELRGELLAYQYHRELRFGRGAFHYLVYSYEGRGDSYGVEVLRSGKALAKLECHQGLLDGLADFFENAPKYGLKVIDPTEE